MQSNYNTFHQCTVEPFAVQRIISRFALAPVISSGERPTAFLVRAIGRTMTLVCPVENIVRHTGYFTLINCHRRQICFNHDTKKFTLKSVRIIL